VGFAAAAEGYNLRSNIFEWEQLKEAARQSCGKRSFFDQGNPQAALVFVTTKQVELQLEW
jgi:hypothetical protein